MSEKLDKLFRDQLESHSSHPRPELWERVEAGLGQKKEKKAVWMYYSIAAALLLLFVLTVWLRWGVQPQMPEQMQLPYSTTEETQEPVKVEEGDNKDHSAPEESMEKIQEAPIRPKNREMAQVNETENTEFEPNEEQVELPLIGPVVPENDLAYTETDVRGDKTPMDESITLLPEDAEEESKSNKKEIRKYAEKQMKNFLIGAPLDSPKGVVKLPEINIPFDKLLAGK